METAIFNMEEKIRVLKNTFIKWIDYLKPLIIEKMRRIGFGIEHFHNKYMDMIREIASDHTTGPAGSAAASALQVHNRITVAYGQLEELKAKKEERDMKTRKESYHNVRNHHYL